MSSEEIYYFTWLPCNKGHISYRYKSTYQCVECLKEYRAINKRRHRLNKYNLTEKDYDDKLKDQNFVCAICKEEETTIDGATQETKILSVDHCHKTKIVRGLLCNNCNHLLGKAKDRIEILSSAIDYLKKYAT